MIPNAASLERAKFYQWLLYLNATLQPELMVYFYPEKHTLGKEVGAIAGAQELLVTEMFALIDRELEGHKFLVGSNFTICDCFLFMLCHWASGFKNPPLSFEHLGRYLRDIGRRKAIVNVCRTEGTSLELYQ